MRNTEVAPRDNEARAPESLPPKVVAPKWEWPQTLQSIVGLIVVVLTVAGPLFPDVSRLPLWFRLLIIGITLVLMAIFPARKGYQRLRAWVQQIHSYSDVHDYAVRTEGALQREHSRAVRLSDALDLEVGRSLQLSREVSQERAQSVSLARLLTECIDVLDTFNVVGAVKHEGEVYLVLDPSSSLKRGDTVWIVDKKRLEYGQLTFYGQYEVSGFTPRGHHIARPVSVWNEVWEGWLNQHVGAITPIELNATAVLVK